MGSFLSSLWTPPPLPGDDPDSAVVAVHSKPAWDRHWEAHRNASKLMVIDFSASWCGPCRFIEPAFKEMASRFADALFVKIDVDELAVPTYLPPPSRFLLLLLACLPRSSTSNATELLIWLGPSWNWEGGRLW
uniref:Thioredoxin domain-containing protein n=1 Tax=Triticum urartu TaxID=4572 RepID=A0A8R7QJL5_TRIUA